MINDLDTYLNQFVNNTERLAGSNTLKFEKTLEDTLKRVIKANEDIPIKVRYLLLFCIEVKQEILDGQLVISVGFDRIGVHKPSLYPTGYPEGADIDVIYNNGWHAKNYVYGLKLDTALPHVTHKRIRSLKDFNYTHFIQEAVSKSAQILNLSEKQFFINDIYIKQYTSRTKGIGTYQFL